jgi:hypothetical protein
MIALAGIVRLTVPGPSRPDPTTSSSSVVSPDATLAKAPYMGVSCPVANSISCDRVGLAVWLRHPADAVTAMIAGRRLSLDYPTWAPGQARRGARTAFTGFLQPAGLISALRVTPDDGPDGWFGTTFPAPPLVQLSIRYANGRVATTELHVELATGWG